MDGFQSDAFQTDAFQEGGAPVLKGGVPMFVPFEEQADDLAFIVAIAED